MCVGPGEKVEGLPSGVPVIHPALLKCVAAMLVR